MDKAEATVVDADVVIVVDAVVVVVVVVAALQGAVMPAETLEWGYYTLRVNYTYRDWPGDAGQAIRIVVLTEQIK
jgi:hypothetical protein